MKKYITLFLSVLMISFYACKESPQKNVLTKEITFKKEGEAILKKQETDSVLTQLDIEIADDEYQRQTGLMYRHSMQNNQAMLFIFNDERPRSFYMKNTEFPLDIIYLNKDKQVVSIQKNAEPFNVNSLPSQKPAQYVLEVNAGLTDKWTLTPGDVLTYTKK